MPDAAPHCPHCGKYLTPPEAAFCTHCGTPVQDAPTTVHGGSLAKIVVHFPGEETREEFLTKAVTTLGRRRTSMIQVTSPIVSGEHARIELTAKGHTLTDLRSTNGTFVNGERLKPDTPRLLTTNDIIRFSDQLGNSVSLTYIAPSGFSEVRERDISRTFKIGDDVSYIGRNPASAICLDHPAISWNHAKITRQDEKDYIIQDLSSNNGTFLNGSQLRRPQKLERGNVLQIGPFNLVYRGEGVLVPYSAERNFRLEAVNLEKNYYPTNLLGQEDRTRPNIVLRHLNLVINPREFVALVGGSGTGKSTLLKALAGISPAASGQVLVNGDDLYHHFNLYRNMMGYVPQDDIIHQGLEVGRALRYAARLRQPDASPTEIKAKVDEVLAKVGMTAQANQMVRSLSGGQRKRVSIAAELLAEPWIFFLDEPTSGLDPGLEKLMMDTLRQLADEGRTIILVTHATANIMSNCDLVAFMARGGEIAYFGPPDQATQFFKVNDFSDIYTRLAQTFAPVNDPTITDTIKPIYDELAQSSSPSPGKNSTAPIPSGRLWAERYRRSPLYESYIANRQTGEQARPITADVTSTVVSFKQKLKQFAILAQRYFDLILRDRISLGVLLLVMPIIALLLLFISNEAALVGHSPTEITAILETDGSYSIARDAQVLLFMMALSANLLGVFAAAYEIIKEEAIYRRERLINLRVLPYFASKLAVLGLFMLLQALLLLLILSFKIKLPDTGVIFWAPLEYYVTLLLTVMAGVALGLFISALVSSRDTVIYLVLITLFVQIVFSGAIFELSPLTRPLSYVTITRWSLEAQGATTNIEALNSLGQIRVTREVDTGRGIQEVTQDVALAGDFYVDYSRSPANLLTRWLMLAGHTLFWSGLALWLIKHHSEI